MEWSFDVQKMKKVKHHVELNDIIDRDIGP